MMGSWLIEDMNTSKIIISQDSKVFRGDAIDQTVVSRMMNTGITKLLGTADAESRQPIRFQHDRRCADHN